SGTNFIAYRPILSVEQYVVERRRTEELLKRQAFRRIAQEIETLPELFVLLLFGSYAKGTQKKDSDIDLLLIAEHAKPIVSKIKSLPLPTHITAITPKELNEMRNSKEFSVVSEALKQNIIIHGIEEYYRFIKDVD
ncbi:MAG: nucleotidyltransferase domain-containing protein, partial [Nanoarchaeota archaeon]